MITLAIVLLAAATARAKPRPAPLCPAGYYTTSIDQDTGAARCRKCLPGWLTAADAEGWTTCVRGEIEAMCRPGSGMISSPQGLHFLTCVPCRPGEESVGIQDSFGTATPVCVARRCRRGTIPVRIPGPVTDYECVAPLETAADWDAVMRPGREGSKSLAPQCPSNECLRYAPEGRAYSCSVPGADERVVVRRGWSICESTRSRPIYLCGDKKARLRTGKCAACPPNSHPSRDTGETECVPNANARPAPQ